ncbi:hypothetical protein SAMN03159422_00493 [Agrobacterium fabrum]|nr:putative carbohydrate-binding protein with CBM5 and CBM33 domain [Agrobacterium fabrum]SDB19055.1 hypothetical protein SAMN03159422_00493 [Agrobacterium fabrum]SEQ34140.1 hypothetical protein SAMN03159504_00494 [Agrobacterium fabrum]
MVKASRVDGFPAPRLIAVVFLLLPIFSSPHRATATEDKALETSATMKDFVRDNPSCIDFTDGCSVCTVADGKIACSAPRIQCQVKELSCTRR